MRRLLLAALFLAVVAAQLTVPALMILGQEQVLRNGEVYRFRTQPVDPYDAFRGRYVRIQLDPNEVAVDPTLRWDRGGRAFVSLGRDSRGDAVLRELSAEPPAAGDYLKVKVLYVSDGRARLQMPVDRYYMQEDLAPAAERAYLEASRRLSGEEARQEAYVDLRVLEGRGVLEELYVGGVPIRQFVLGRSPTR